MFCYFLIGLSCIIDIIHTTSSCQIKMATNSMAIFKLDDRLIFNSGVVSNSFLPTSADKYTVNEETELEYFYIFENKSAASHIHDQIRVTIYTTNTNLTATAVVSNENSQFQENYDMTAIKISYMYTGNTTEKVNMSMVVVSDNCDPFTIHWVKLCGKKKTVPKINVGLTAIGNEIVSNGNFTNSINVSNTNKKLVIPKNVFTLDLFLSAGSDVKFNEPRVVYNQDSLAVLVKGTLSKGGMIVKNAQALQLSFACTPLRQTLSDIHVQIPFGNSTNVDLFFSKECDTVNEVEQYFTALYMMYWILLVLVIMFILVIMLYLLRSQDMTLFDLINKAQEMLMEHWRKIKHSTRGNYKDKENLIKEKDNPAKHDQMILYRDKKMELSEGGYGAI